MTKDSAAWRPKTCYRGKLRLQVTPSIVWSTLSESLCTHPHSIASHLGFFRLLLFESSKAYKPCSSRLAKWFHHLIDLFICATEWFMKGLTDLRSPSNGFIKFHQPCFQCLRLLARKLVYRSPPLWYNHSFRLAANCYLYLREARSKLDPSGGSTSKERWQVCLI